MPAVFRLSRASRRRSSATLLAAASVLVVAAPMASAGTWSAGVIDGPAGTTRVRPLAVNTSGVVVGTARFPGETNDHAFRWENGTMTELQTLPGTWTSAANDINDAGTIVGSISYGSPGSDSGSQAVTWTASTTTSSVHELQYDFQGAADHTSHYGSVAYGINAQGDVVGVASVHLTDPDFQQNVPFVALGGGAFTRLYLGVDPARTDDEFPFPSHATDRTGGEAWGIDAHRRVVATGALGPNRIALFGEGVVDHPQLLDAQPGLHPTNEAGDIVGYTALKSGRPQTAVLRTGTTTTDLTRGSTTVSQANAVNPHDWAVGRVGTEWYQAVDVSSSAGYVWRPNDPPTSLTSVAPAGYTIYNGTDINDRGMVVGTGSFGGKSGGVWLAPAGVAVQVTGTVRSATGAPVAGVQVGATRRTDGQPQGSPAATGADGRYTLTLPPGAYAIGTSAAGYVATGAGCTVTAGACLLDLDENAVVDFDAVATASGGSGGTDAGGAGAGAGAGAGSSGEGAAGAGGGGAGSGSAPGAAGAKGTAAPQVAFASKTSLIVGKAGKVVVPLGTSNEASTGTVTLTSRSKLKLTKTGKAKILALGTGRFTAAAGQAPVITVVLGADAKRYLRSHASIAATATLTATDAAGNVTRTSAKLTIKARS